MSFDNGESNAGGNGSVYWHVRGKKVPKGQGAAAPMALANLSAAAMASAGVNTITPTTLPHVPGAPGRGEVKIGKTPTGESLVEGHDDSNFADIGISNPPKPAQDRQGMFRVRLRFRDADWDKLTEPERSWIALKAVRIPELDPDSRFLVIDVPAIARAAPASGQDWPANEPWEIHYEW